VLTPLGREDTPLLRYRTGDLVRARWDARGCRLDGGILGRADDMVVVRGVNIYPGAVESVVRSVPGILEYRVHLGFRGNMREVEVEAEAGSADAVRALERALESAFSLRIPVRGVAEGTLPRFEMKARRWLKSEGAK
jgi:phenylacetate-CoA ligase